MDCSLRVGNCEQPIGSQAAASVHRLLEVSVQHLHQHRGGDTCVKLLQTRAECSIKNRTQEDFLLKQESLQMPFMKTCMCLRQEGKSGYLVSINLLFFLHFALFLFGVFKSWLKKIIALLKTLELIHLY